MRTWCRVLCSAVVVLLAVAGARADIVSGNAAFDLGSGMWDYSYTVASPSGAPDDVFLFELTNLSPGFDVTGTPIGWDSFPLGGTLDWVTFDVGIGPGSSLGGFSLRSAVAPGDVSYEVVGLESSDYKGTTTGPSLAVPEPSSLALLPMAFGGLALWRRRRGI